MQIIKSAIRDVLREEIGGVCKGYLEGKFYQNLAVEMESDIGAMYQEINEFKKGLDLSQHSFETQKTIDASERLVSDASGQLEEIVKTTEGATNQIMDAVENCQDRNKRVVDLVRQIAEPAVREEILDLLAAVNQDYMNIITACAFQDLTGQRVKKVVELIKHLEKEVIVLLVKAGAKIRGKKAGKEDHEIEGETNAALAKLKGPQKEGVDQAGVDDILASLGL
ncbi:MAG: protein phosphatase CheZ [Deltaproteobacteria bacterium]